MRSEVTVLLSGGIDSATVLALVQPSDKRVECFFVDYGQHAVNDEREASQTLANYFGVPWSDVVVRGPTTPGSGEVRARNDLLLSLVSFYSGAERIATGVHSGTPYADCSDTYLSAWQDLLDAQHWGSRRLLAPLRYLTKAEVIALARHLNVPIWSTYSCEEASGPCDRCSSCRDISKATSC